MADYHRIRDDEWYEAPKYHTVPNSRDIDDDYIEKYLSTNSNVEDLSPYLINKHNFFVDYDEFPLTVPKKQVRCKGQPSQQRLEQGQANIKLHLIFEEDIEFKDILKVHLKVRRANTVPLFTNVKKLYTGYVLLHPVEMFRQEGSATNRVTVYANLDNLREDDYSHNIYDLSKNNKKHNEFNVLIEVKLHDNSISNFTTKTFSVVGQRFAEKRKGPNSPDSSSSSKIRIFENFIDPSENKNFAQHQRIVCELIEAKQGIFDNLKASVIKTGNGDIAYHFVLKDQEDGANYIPGEIIGFTTDHHGKGVVIDKLSPSNAEKAFLKGVVTESQYIEAKLPQDRTVITATICMLGVVPVRVMGPVNPGEGLFASNALPGTAISKKFLESPKPDSLIGYAFEGVECHRDEVNGIQALVSIISGAGHLLVERQLTVLEKNLKSSITFNMKRSRKFYTLVTLIVVLLLILLGFFVYQLKGTGTWYKKMICKQDSTGFSKYWYWLQGGEYHGYQFKNCETAWKKAITERRFYDRPHSETESEPKCINETREGIVIRYNYYINQDSCAGTILPGSRYLFAVDEKCETLWLFDEVDGKWIKDKRVCFNPRCNIMCNDDKRKCPSYGWRRC